MRQSHHKIAFRILIAGTAALALTLLTLNALAKTVEPAIPNSTAARLRFDEAFVSGTAASPAGQREPITSTSGLRRRRPGRGREPTDAVYQPTADGDVTIVKSVTTGSDGDQIVYNGERITYTLTVENHGDAAATNIAIFDILPDALDQVECVGECRKIMDSRLILTPLGGFVRVSVTTEITWSITSLPADPPDNVTHTVFSGRVIGRSDGTVVRNKAELEYDGGVTLSNETETTVRVRVEDDGRPTLSESPTWLSSDLGGTLSLDWGDFDRDGHLDLALGSTAGTAVYRYDSETGRLTLFWDNVSYTLGVRWADLNANGQLELVAVGDSVEHSAVTTGTNYIYAFDGTQFVRMHSFSSDVQLLRVEPGYYDHDDSIDLVASTNAIDAECPVRLYLNPGDGRFFDDFDDCISDEATASIAPGDYDNDGDSDLALGTFPNTTRLLLNRGTGSPFIKSYVDVDASTTFLPYDFAWGDYDNDGYLDLAAAFPLDRKVLIYHNQPLNPQVEATLDKGMDPLSAGTLVTIPPSQQAHDLPGAAAGLNAPSGYPGRRTYYDPVPLAPQASTNVLLLYADDGPIPLTAILESYPDIGGVGEWLVNYLGSVPSLSDLLAYDVVIVWSNYEYLDNVALGDVLADYVDAGGRVIVATFSWNAPFCDLAGRFVNEFYNPFISDVAGTHYSWASLGAYDAGHPIMAGVTAASDYYRDYLSLDPGAYLVASWDDGEEFIATKGTVVAINSYTGPYRQWTDDMGIIFHNAVNYLMTLTVEVPPLRKLVRLPSEIRTSQFRTPLAIDWGDFDGDGRLDLFVADVPPKVYLNASGSFSQTRFVALVPDAVDGQVWSMAAADQDNDGDLDLALGNRDGASLIFTAFGPFLDPRLTEISARPAGSVAWGDADGNGYLDLLFGGDGDERSARLYYNRTGVISSGDMDEFPLEIRGPHSVAFGDANSDGDRRLDVAVGTKWENRVYLAGSSLPSWASSETDFTHSVAWGDADGDGDLDLLVGNNGSNRLYVSQGTGSAYSLAWTSVEDDDTTSVAWGDYDNDGYLDFAAGNYGQPNRIYHNNGENAFDLVWSSLFLSNTTSVAWADYDGDLDPSLGKGDLDLAVGNDGQANLIYENVAGTFGPANMWRSDTLSLTTSLAWGDWDNDGDLDLAVGNDSQPDQVYTNQGSEPGSPRLLWLWTSAESYQTTGVAWGDRDNDGDLDLAISQKGTDQDDWNGFFENNYVVPSHLTDHFTPTMPLPNNPSYVVITRPGTTDAAYLFSSAELLAYPSPLTPTVSISVHYRLYDPDGTRTPSSDMEGDAVAGMFYHFSLDGGGTWVKAHGITPTATTSRKGQEAVFLWNVQNDQAISDDARFRVTIVHQNPVGPVQRASTSALSPPFRVRTAWCVWPLGPSITAPASAEPDKEITFRGTILEASGVLTFTWDFGDGTPVQHGQMVRHSYAIDGLYEVKMTVTSEPCPLARVVTATRTIIIGTGVSPIFLPLIMNSATAGALDASPAPETELEDDFQPPVEFMEPIKIDNQPTAEVRWPPVNPMTVDAISSGGVFLPDVTVITDVIPLTITAWITVSKGGIHSQPSINGDGRRIAFWSTGDFGEFDPCIYRDLGEVDILLVDDDDNSPDVRAYYTDALDALGVTYDVWDTFRSDVNEPLTDTLAAYEGVIWFSGDAYCGSYAPCAGPGPAAEAALAWFLDNGGFLFISSQDYLYDHAINYYTPTPFMSTYLGLGPFAHDVWQSVVAGAGSVFGELGLHWLAYPPYFYNFSDRISPDGTAELAFIGDWGDAAVNKEGEGDYRTTFWGFPFEALPSEADRLEAMKGALYWLGFGCRFTRVTKGNDDGNIEVFLADVHATRGISPTFTEVSYSSGNILGGFNLWPSISADGSRIALFSDRALKGENTDENFEIFVYDMSINDFMQVTDSLGGVNLWPSISADGTHIAFVSDGDYDEGQNNGDSNQEIFVAEIDPGGRITYTQVTSTTQGYHDQPAISGNGRRVACVYYDDAGNNPEIRLYDDIMTSSPTLLSTIDEGNNVQPALDYDGTHIAFASDRYLSVGNPDENQEIFLAEIGPTGEIYPTQVTSTTRRINEQPSIDGNGVRIAFVSVPQIWLYDHDAREAILLSRAGDSNSRPSISRGGMHVAFAARGQIYRAVQLLADLAVDKYSAPDTIVPGEGMTYTIAVRNAGPVAVDGAVVSDTIPTEILAPSWSCEASSAGPCTTPEGGQHTLNQSINISVAGAITYTVSGTLDPEARGELRNIATVATPADVTDRNRNNNTRTVTDRLELQADLTVSKSAVTPTIVAGTTLTYTLTYTNNGGPSYAWNITITDRLPAGVAYVGVVSGPEPSARSGQLVTWTLPSLADTGTGEIVFTTTVASWLTDAVTNSAVITSSSSDPDPNNNDDDESTAITTSADLAVTKSAVADTAVAGRTLTYTLLYNNVGPSDAQNVYITDTLPISVAWDGVVIAVDPPLFGPTATAEPGTWYWYTPTLPAGTWGTITFAVTVTDSFTVPGSVTNRVTVTGSTSDPDGNNNDDDETTAVAIPVDLAVGKSVQPIPVTAGKRMTYTIIVTNLSSITVTGATVYDLIPSEVGHGNSLSWNCTPSPPAGSSCTASSTDNPINDVVDIAAGGRLIYTVTGRLHPHTTNDVINTVTVTVPAGFIDEYTDNNSASAPGAVSQEADLAVSKTVDDTRPNEGENIVYTLIVSNTIGPSIAPNAVLTDTLPAGIQYTSHITSQGSYDNISGQWTIGDLPLGATATLTITATVDSGTAGMTITNVINGLDSDADDPRSSNDTDSVIITVNSPPIFTSTPVTVATEDLLYTCNITAADVDVGDTLTITAPVSPTWLILADNGDGTATLGGTPTNEDVGDHSVRLQVEDTVGATATQAFSITVANANDPPTFTSTPVTTATVGVTYTYNITATDVDVGDTLTITAPVSPTWLMLTDNGDGTAMLSGTPAILDVGDHNVRLQVEDSVGVTATQAFSITVAATSVMGTVSDSHTTAINAAVISSADSPNRVMRVYLPPVLKENWAPVHPTKLRKASQPVLRYPGRPANARRLSVAFQWAARRK